MGRPIGELEVRVMPVLLLLEKDQELKRKLIEFAKEKSPSAVFPLAQTLARLAGKSQFEALALAKATRWLAIILRDYGKAEFERIVKSQ